MQGLLDSIKSVGKAVLGGNQEEEKFQDSEQEKIYDTEELRQLLKQATCKEELVPILQELEKSLKYFEDKSDFYDKQIAEKQAKINQANLKKYRYNIAYTPVKRQSIERYRKSMIQGAQERDMRDKKIEQLNTVLGIQQIKIQRPFESQEDPLKSKKVGQVISEGDQKLEVARKIRIEIEKGSSKRRSKSHQSSQQNRKPSLLRKSTNYQDDGETWHIMYGKENPSDYVMFKVVGQNLVSQPITRGVREEQKQSPNVTPDSEVNIKPDLEFGVIAQQNCKSNLEAEDQNQVQQSITRGVKEEQKSSLNSTPDFKVNVIDQPNIEFSNIAQVNFKPDPEQLTDQQDDHDDKAIQEKPEFENQVQSPKQDSEKENVGNEPKETNDVGQKSVKKSLHDQFKELKNRLR